MGSEPPADAHTLKAAMRREVLALRRAQPDKDALSRQIAERFQSLAAYRAARCVMFYVDARSEARTREAISAALAAGKMVVVPQCEGDELTPWRIASLAELEPGAFGIAEPSPIVRSQPARRMDLSHIDLVVVPGVAFDRCGRRLGSGRGFYDRLLPRLNNLALRVGWAFDCQIVGEVPSAAHDVRMHVVVTPSELIADTKPYADFRTM